MSNELVIKEENTAISANLLSDYQAFENAQRMAKMLMQSKLIPANFQNNLPDCLVALEIAQRTNNSPFVVMQNLNVIQGTPRWSSKYVAAALAASKVTNIRYELVSKGRKKVETTVYEWDDVSRRKIARKITEDIEDMVCCMVAKDRRTGEALVGPEVSIEMAVLEGWYSKTGSKWKTMPGIMLRYRAATFFANAYYPDIMIGLSIEDEAEVPSVPVHDISTPEIIQSGSVVTPQSELSSELPAKSKVSKKTKAKQEEVVEEQIVASEDEDKTEVVSADFKETVDEIKPTAVVAPKQDDSDEWDNWGD